MCSWLLSPEGVRQHIGRKGKSIEGIRDGKITCGYIHRVGSTTTRSSYCTSRGGMSSKTCKYLGIRHTKGSVPPSLIKSRPQGIVSNSLVNGFFLTRFESNTVHKNRLICLSSDFQHHCASNKGGSWINWGLRQVYLIENQTKIVRVQYSVN